MGSNMKYCPKCYTVRKNGEEVCRNCGFVYEKNEKEHQGVSKIKKSKSSNMKYCCPKCYALRKNGEKVCHKCGYKYWKRNQKIGLGLVGVALLMIIAFVLCNEYVFCKQDSCIKLQATDSDYCDEHTCHYEGCSEPCNQDNLGDYCIAHTCTANGCRAARIEGSNYCSTHNICQYEGCSNQCVKTSNHYANACAEHKCVDVYCSDVKKLAATTVNTTIAL